MKVKPHNKPNEVLVPKPTPEKNPTNQRFVFCFDGRGPRDCPTTKPQPNSKIY